MANHSDPIKAYVCGSTRFSCDRRQPAFFFPRRVTRQDNILCASLLRALVLTRVLARDLVLTPTFRNPHDSTYLSDSATYT